MPLVEAAWWSLIGGDQMMSPLGEEQNRTTWSREDKSTIVYIYGIHNPRRVVR